MTAGAFRQITATCGALALVLGCAPDGSDPPQSPPPPTSKAAGKADGAGCSAPAAVACVTACGLDPTGDGPTCRNGVWTCAAGLPDTACPEFQGQCAVSEPCGYGYYCVDSFSYPVPSPFGICRKGSVARDASLESCGTDGTTPTSELITTRQALLGRIIKVEGQVGAAMKCHGNGCWDGDPCCQTCVGDFVMDVRLAETDERRLRLRIRMDSLACAGTNCDVQCGPMLVGDRYHVWGLLHSCTDSECTLFFMGACPSDR